MVKVCPTHPNGDRGHKKCMKRNYHDGLWNINWFKWIRQRSMAAKKKDREMA
jgi:hypothetical protein